MAERLKHAPSQSVKKAGRTLCEKPGDSAMEASRRFLFLLLYLRLGVLQTSQQVLRIGESHKGQGGFVNV